MTKERLQIEAIQLAEKANRMVKSGELSKFQADNHQPISFSAIH